MQRQRLFFLKDPTIKVCLKKIKVNKYENKYENIRPGYFRAIDFLSEFFKNSNEDRLYKFKDAASIQDSFSGTDFPYCALQL